MANNIVEVAGNRYVVDLVREPGALYPEGSNVAEAYLTVEFATLACS